MRYPAFISLENQPVTVVGAGRVAERKVRTLLAAKADIKVISPQATPVLRRFAAAKKIRLLRRRYRAGDLRGAWVVIAATDDENVNCRVCAEAKKRKLLVNSAAPPAAGNFIVPSLIRRGQLAVAISTGGASPALARQLRRELEEFIGDGYGAAAKKLRALRKSAATSIRSAKKRAALYRREVKQLLRQSRKK